MKIKRLQSDQNYTKLHDKITMMSDPVERNEMAHSCCKRNQRSDTLLMLGSLIIVIRFIPSMWIFEVIATLDALKHSLVLRLIYCPLKCSTVMSYNRSARRTDFHSHSLFISLFTVAAMSNLNTIILFIIHYCLNDRGLGLKVTSLHYSLLPHISQQHSPNRIPWPAPECEIDCFLSKFD